MSKKYPIYQWNGQEWVEIARDGKSPIKGVDYFDGLPGPKGDSFDEATIGYLENKIEGKIAEIKIPEPVDVEALKEEMTTEFGKVFERNINILGMPDFRKLAMGLQSQIDDLGGGSGTVGPGTINEIAYFDTTTSIASLATATYPSLTELSYVKGVTSAIQTQINTKAASAGALTQFVGNGNWKVFYSDGSGDVQELTVGAAGTFLQGNGVTSAPTWGTPAGSGDVSKVGTPVDNQIGVWTGDGTIEGDAGFLFDSAAGTLTLYEAVNDANPTFHLGSSAAEEIIFGANYASGTQTLSYIDYYTKTASATADFGAHRFTVDAARILDIDDGGINFQASKGISIAGTDIITDSAGTATLSNIDGLDDTTESTIEAAIETLANLVSIQGRTVTLADAGANALFGWDDTAGAYENLSQAEARTILGLGTAAYVATDLADLNEATIEGAIDTLANLTSIQGRTVTLADAGANALFGWDDTAGAYENLSQAEARTILGLGTAAYVATDLADLNEATIESAIDTLANLTAASALATVGTVTSGVWSSSITSATLTNALTLSENASIALDPAGSADGKYSGITVAGTAGATLAFGDLIYLDPTDSRWELADANSASGADGDPRGILGICVLAAAADGNATTILLHGIVRADAVFPAMTVNAPMYVSGTAGDITGTAPTTSGDVVRIVGIAITADEIFFNPTQDWLVHN